MNQKSKSNGFLRHSYIIVFGILCSRLTGFLRDIVFANFLGLSLISDAFFAAFKLPNIMRKIFAEGGLIMSFIPVFSPEVKNNKKKALIFAGKVLSILLLSLIISIILMQIFMIPLISFINPGFNKIPQKLLLAISYSRVTTFLIFFMSITALFGAMLNSIGVFFYYAFGTVVFNLTIFFCIVLGSKLFPNFDIGMIASISVVIGGVTPLIFVLIGIFKHNLKTFPQKITYDEKVKKFFNALPASIFSSYIINIFIDMIFASFFVSGVSYIYYTERIGNIPISLIGYTLSVIVLPFLSQTIKDGKIEESNQIQQDAITISIFFSIPVMIYMYQFSDQIISIFYIKSHFTNDNLKILSNILKLFSISIPFNIILKVFNASFFASGYNKISIILSLFSIIINILCNLFLMKSHGIYSMIYSLAISSIFNMFVAYFFLLKYKIYKPNQYILLKNFFISSLLSIFNIQAIKYLYNMAKSHNSQSLSLIYFIFISVICFALYLKISLPILKKTKFGKS